MADQMTFPKTFEEFIEDYSFKDTEKIYTNGAKLIPTFRVWQAWDHYIGHNINIIYKNLDEIMESLEKIKETIG